MKAIVNTAAGRVEWQDWPMPEPGPGQVRIRTAACGVCVTDLAMIAGWQRTGFPAIPGHEWSGMVDCVGPGADRALLGKPCVAENVLSDGKEVGFEHPGGYGQYFLTEANNVYPLPVDFPPAVAALIEPLAVCVHASRRLRLEDCRSALILGDGTIGLLMLFVLKAMKVQQVAFLGGRAARLSLARDVAACTVLNYHEAGPDLSKAVMALPGSALPGGRRGQRVAGGDASGDGGCPARRQDPGARRLWRQPRRLSLEPTPPPRVGVDRLQRQRGSLARGGAIGRDGRRAAGAAGVPPVARRSVC